MAWSAASLGCTGDGALASTGETTNETKEGDGDGDPSSGDGDPSSGDGDGDPGDGDGDPGDGDGDPSGDGDGDPSGDGDGDPSGDGDGDPEPITAHLSYLGGTGNGSVYVGAVRDVAFDDEGNIYATGGVSYPGYASEGAADTSYAGGQADAFVASFTPTGELRFFTYLGGSGHDRAYGIAVNATGVYIGGRAGAGFPTTGGALAPSFSRGGGGEYGTQDGFVAKLSLDGTQWEWVTYVGGGGPEFCRDVDVDSQGQAWCAMIGVSFPIAQLDDAPGGLQPGYGGGSRDAALLQLSADGSSLVFGTYIGGSSDEVGAASVRVLADDGVLYQVSTTSDNVPQITQGTYQQHRNGAADALLLRLDSTGALEWGTLYGGSGDEAGETHNLAAGDDGSAYLAMFTTSWDLPGANNQTDGEAGFIAHISADGSQLLGATYVGGSTFDEIEGVDAHMGRVVVSGGTVSGDFGPTDDAAFPGSGGSIDGFIAVYDQNLGAPIYVTRLPGQHYDWANAVAFGPTGAIAFGGNTQSSDLPTSVNAFEPGPNPSIPGAGGEIAYGYDAGHVGWLPAPD